MELRLHVSARQRKSTLERFGLWQAARPGMHVRVEADLINAQGRVLPLETSIFVGSNRQSSQDQLAWLSLPKSAHQTLAEWLDEALMEIGASIGCHGETALTLAIGTRNSLPSTADLTPESTTDSVLRSCLRVAI